MADKRIKTKKRPGFARPMTQREIDWIRSYEADIVTPVRQLQAKRKKKRTGTVNSVNET